MSTFNAGAIEANLTLGRSSWTKDLRLTKREIADLERKAITIGIDADADNALIQMSNVEALAEDFDQETYAATLDIDAAQANATLDALDARLDALDRRTVTFMIDADADNAEIQMSNIEALLEDLDGETYKPKVDLITRDAAQALAALKAELDLLDARTVTVMVDADTDNAHVGLSLLEADLDYLDQETVTIPIDVDAAQAQSELIAIGSFVQALDNSDINLDVDVNGFARAVAQMNILEAQVDILDGRDIDLNVDVDRQALKDLLGSASGGSSGGGGYLGIFRILLYAVIALLPVLAVMSSTAGAAILGLAGALSAAIGPAAVLAIGIAGLIQRFKEAQEAGELSDVMERLADALDTLDDAWNEFLDNIEVQGFNLMAVAVETLAMVLPTLAPLFNATAKAMVDVLAAIQQWINSPEYEQMLAFFMDFGIDMLESFLEVGGNLIRFFGYLFEAMAPFIRIMMSGLEDVTEGWLNWSRDLQSNDAFQTWIDNTLKYGPMVLDMLGSMVDAFYNIGEALLPFAGPLLTGLTSFFDFIANMDTGTLSLVIALFSGLYLGAKLLLPIVTSLISFWPVLAGVFTALGGPLIAIIAGVAALGAVLAAVWNDSKKFRDIVTESWESLLAIVQPVIEEIRAFIMDNMGPVRDWWDQTWRQIKGVVIQAWQAIMPIVQHALEFIVELWNRYGDNIMHAVKTIFRTIGGIISGAFKVIRGIFQVIKGVLTGDWKAIWTGIQNIVKGAVKILGSVIRGLLEIAINIFDVIRKALTDIWNNTWGKLRDSWDSFRSWIGDRWAAFKEWLKTPINVGDIFGSIRDALKDALNAVISLWNNFSLTLDIPDKIPGLPGDITISTPNVGYLAKGAYVDEAMLAVVGEGQEPEIVAPESKMKSMVDDAVARGGGGMDYNRLAAAVAAAMAAVMQQFGGAGLTREQLYDILANAQVLLKVEASQDVDTLASRIVGGVGFELRRLGFGGANNV